MKLIPSPALFETSAQAYLRPLDERTASSDRGHRRNITMNIKTLAFALALAIGFGVTAVPAFAAQSQTQFSQDDSRYNTP